MENILPTIFEWLSILLLIALWIYFFVYSCRHKVTFPWGVSIVIAGILVSGVGYLFYNNQTVVFSISLPLAVSLVGVLWDINNVRKQFYIRNAGVFLRFIGIGLINGFLLGYFFIVLQGTKYIQPDSRYTETAVVAVVIQAGMAEELLFRGYLLSYLIKYECNRFFAIVFQALVFAFLHASLYSGNWMALSIVYLVGVITGYFTWKNNNLIPAFVLHIVFNLMTVMWWLKIT